MNLDDDIADGYVVCDDRLAQCRCVNVPGHKGPHVCSDKCGGSWEYDAKGLVIVKLPGLDGMFTEFEELLGKDPHA